VKKCNVLRYESVVNLVFTSS